MMGNLAVLGARGRSLFHFLVCMFACSIATTHKHTVWMMTVCSPCCYCHIEVSERSGRQRKSLNLTEHLLRENWLAPFSLSLCSLLCCVFWFGGARCSLSLSLSLTLCILVQVRVWHVRCRLLQSNRIATIPRWTGSFDDGVDHGFDHIKSMVSFFGIQIVQEYTLFGPSFLIHICMCAYNLFHRIAFELICPVACSPHTHTRTQTRDDE